MLLLSSPLRRLIHLKSKKLNYSLARRYYCPPGDRIRIIREGRFNGDKLELVPVGQEDIFDKVQQFAPFCDLHYMLHRLKVGDTSVMAKSAPLYGDFSGMPDNPVDMINFVSNARNKFDALDTETRQKYNMDYMRWLSAKMKPNVPSETLQEGVEKTE